MKSADRQVGLFCVFFTLLLTLLHGHRVPIERLTAASGTVALTQAQFLLDPHDTLRSPPADMSSAQVVSLPHVWRAHDAEMRGIGWYRVRFEAPSDNLLQTLLIPRLGLNANIYFDGTLISTYGDLRTDVFFRPWNRATLIRLPGEQLTAGVHQIDVELLGLTNYFTGLGTLVIGPDQAVQAYFSGRYFMQNTLALIAAGLCFATAGALLATGRLMGNSREFFIAAFLMLNLGLWSSGFSTFQLPFGMTFYARAMYTLHTLTLVSLIQIFVFRIGSSYRRNSLLLWLLAVTQTLLLWNLDMDSLLAQLGLITGLMGGVGMVLIGRSLANGSSEWDFPGLAPAVALMVYIALTFYDLSVVLTETAFNQSLITPFLGLLLPMAGAYYLLIRFVETLQQVRGANQQLQQAVSEAKIELSQQYEKLAEVEKGRLLHEERQRLMADMHDGIGSQLISTLTALKSEPLAQREMVGLLQQCIDDLRLTIDSLEPTHQDILTLLGNFRYRMEPRLKQLGIKLNWRVDDIPDLDYLNPRKSLQLLRIVQEAFTNILKHAACTEISFEVRHKPTAVVIDITDNGQGSPQPNLQGKGLGNMARRAAQTGFELETGKRDPLPGYRVRVTLPVKQ